jgi:hypothetical protein
LGLEVRQWEFQVLHQSQRSRSVVGCSDGLSPDSLACQDGPEAHIIQIGKETWEEGQESGTQFTSLSLAMCPMSYLTSSPNQTASPNLPPTLS